MSTDYEDPSVPRHSAESDFGFLLRLCGIRSKDVKKLGRSVLPWKKKKRPPRKGRRR